MASTGRRMAGGGVTGRRRHAAEAVEWRGRDDGRRRRRCWGADVVAEHVHDASPAASRRCVTPKVNASNGSNGSTGYRSRSRLGRIPDQS